MNYDISVTLEATHHKRALELAKRLYPEYYPFTFKSLAGRKQHPDVRGLPSSYIVFMLKRKGRKK